MKKKKEKQILPESMRESCSRFFASQAIPFDFLLFIVADSVILK